jgi:acyl-CoA reductase-like NAD-dependent aldehyde dehydrogenase
MHRHKGIRGGWRRFRGGRDIFWTPPIRIPRLYRIPIIRCPNDIGRIIEISNSTAYGLSSGLCTQRLDYITRFVEELEVGSVNVWEVPGYRLEISPFGGIKDSGLGYKEGVLEAMRSFSNQKTYSFPWA